MLSALKFTSASLSSSGGSGSGIPEHWRTSKDDAGRIYYFHTITRASTYAKPPRLPQGWHVTRSKAGVIYFYNSLTRTTLPFSETPPGAEEAVAALRSGLAPPPSGTPPGRPTVGAASSRLGLSLKGLLSPRGAEPAVMSSPRGGTPRLMSILSPRVYEPPPPRHLRMAAEDVKELQIEVEKVVDAVGVRIVSLAGAHGALSVGDVLLTIDHQKLPDAEAAHTLLRGAEGELVLVISSDTQALRERTRSQQARLRSAVALRVALFVARSRKRRAGGKPKMGDRMSDYI